MSILIDWDLPTACRDCALQIGGYCHIYTDDIKRIDDVNLIVGLVSTGRSRREREMNLSDEIRKQIEKNKGLKLAVGEINNHLSILEGLLRNERDNAQKQVNEAYQRGLDDAWEAARKIVCDEKLDWNTLLHIFNRSNFEGIFGDFSPSEAIDKLKSYKEKQKAEDKIDVGDEVNWLGDYFIVTRIFQPRNMKEQCDGIDDDGCVYHDVLIKDLEKTGRHFDIQSILEEMRT